MEITTESSINLTVNGKLYTIEDASPTTSLNSWLRLQPGLTGTKVMCHEGGCGCCVVALQKTPTSKMDAINSCLVLLGSLDGCSITTTEGIGSSRKGFHQIQSRIAEFGGSQCGYCTPGMVMNMFSLLSEDPSPTQQKIEDSFDGNLCRCTGYRPILDAMKSFASDADPKLVKQCSDIEDLDSDFCYLQCSLNKEKNRKVRPLRLSDGVTSWVRPVTFNDLKAIIKAQPAALMVCGHTANGVYHGKSSSSMVDITAVPELTGVKQAGSAYVFGACINLSTIITTLSATSSKVFKSVAEHLEKVANLPVRNLASWAGNLMLKHQHNEFPSDVFVLLEGARATIELYDVTNDQVTNCSPEEFLAINMDQKIIMNVTISPEASLDAQKFASYKIASRPQNAHAYINAAFTADVTKDQKSFSKSPTLVFGGVSSTFVHATNTEKFLDGKVINSASTLAEALSILSDEVKPVQLDGADATVKYKHDLVMALFYKFYLSLCDSGMLAPDIVSGISPLVRDVSTATQSFTNDPSTFPVGEKIMKLSAKLQASGEAVFVTDHPVTNNELHCAFVVSDTANADIDEIYDSMASLMPGFVQIIKGSNLPPELKNTHLFPFDTTRPIIAVDHVDFVGQPVAIVVAETSSQAYAISRSVTVTYKNEGDVIVTIDDAIKAQSFYDNPSSDTIFGNPDHAMTLAKNKVSGEIALGNQYHFYMETQVCRAEPTEEGGFKLEVGTQTQKWLQDAVAYAFNLTANKIEVSTKRVGGAYGGKSTNSLITTCAAALAAYCTQRPVTLHPGMQTCSTTYGTRNAYTIKYTVGFDDTGVVGAMDVTLYTNSGCSAFDAELDDPTVIPTFADNAYFCPNRKYKSYVCKTNTPSSTWCRSPSSLQLTGFADQIIEHVASFLNKDSIVVKAANFYKIGQMDLSGEKLEYCNIGKLTEDLLASTKYDDRQQEIATFNQNNRWKKKGLAVSPMKFKIDYRAGKYTTLVSICSGDGTVVVSHGGIESGQGINTKVAQVAAFELGIPLSSVMVQRTNNVTSSNSQVTGGSITSEVCCGTVMECCKTLRSRIDPIRNKMPSGTSWKDVIAQCYNYNVDLAYSTMWIPPSTGKYNSYGVTSSEVELDVLTGQYNISRVDTVFDCGISLNPEIDIGQVEGAFVMGLGFWLTENFVVDEETGKVLTPSTWEYKPPSTKDIPMVWNIELLPNAPNPLGVLRSKASGEPPMCMAISVLNALKRALQSTKHDRENTDFFQMPTPATVEKIFLTGNLDPLKDFVLK